MYFYNIFKKKFTRVFLLMLSLHSTKTVSFQDSKNPILEVPEHNVRPDFTPNENLIVIEVISDSEGYPVAIVAGQVTLDTIIVPSLRSFLHDISRQNIDDIAINAPGLPSINNTNEINNNENTANPGVSADFNTKSVNLNKNKKHGSIKRKAEMKKYDCLRQRNLSKSSSKNYKKKTVAPVNSNQYTRITRDNARSKNVMVKAPKIKQNFKEKNKRTNYNYQNIDRKSQKFRPQ